MDHLSTIETAWANPNSTKAALPASDVNAVLAKHYVGCNIRLTRTQLWDMEVRKAGQPDKYLGPVVRPGSAYRFPSTFSDDGRYDDFTRISDQRCFLDPDTFTTVIENVRLDHKTHFAYFNGVNEFATPDGKVIKADGKQPVFHVEHGATGTEEDPLNTWRIVLETKERDAKMENLFKKMGESVYLRAFVEVYIREDLGLKLERI